LPQQNNNCNVFKKAPGKNDCPVLLLSGMPIRDPVVERSVASGAGPFDAARACFQITHLIKDLHRFVNGG